MSIPFRIRRAEWVAGGFIVLLGIGAIVALLLVTRATGSFEGRARYTARLSQAHGIVEGSRVDMLGIQIGLVEEVRITDANEVELVLDLRREYAEKIHTDSKATVTASIGLQSMLGGVGLSISPGTAGASLPPGSQIPVLEPERLVDMMPNVQNDPFLEDLQVLAHNLREVSGQAADPDGRIRQIATDVGDLVARVKKGEGTAGKLLADDAAMYNRLLATLEKLDATLGRADKLLQRSEKVVARGGGMLTEAERTMKSADGLISSADELVDSADKVVKKTGPVLDSTDDAMKGMKGAMNKFANVTEDLSDIVASLEQLVQEMRVVTEAAGRVYPIRKHVKKIRREQASRAR